ncbi:MAG TPA: hypothetical protein VIE43_26985, partial [Thermoanaerobaculia bacterium]|nr:hypothetical protein [Thermoanaerobaculia bacterium]
MSDSVHYFQLNYPQLDRVISRIESLDAPVVQVWGWPGSGRAAILEALLARLGGRALSLAVLASEEELAAAIADAYEAGVPWLVANGAPRPEWIVDAERWLRPGQRLVFATGRGPGAGALLRGIVSPQELLLNDREIAGLA